ncbi:hypothetical protein [Burkholderia ambifaria]|jgi:hypothetical protein|nr:hypothetical protein [Burkholderia ambifaria]
MMIQIAAAVRHAITRSRDHAITRSRAADRRDVQADIARRFTGA